MSDRIPYLDRLGAAFHELQSERNGVTKRARRSSLAVAAGTAIVSTAILGAVIAGPLSGGSGGPADRATGRSESTSPGAAVRDHGSERAWAGLRLTGAEEVEQFSDLETMTNSASVVVRAEVVAVEPGRMLGEKDAAGGGAIEYISVSLEPISTLASRGDVIAGSSGLIQLELGPVETDFEVDSLAKEITGDEVLAFLRLKGSTIPQVNNPEQPDELALGVYRVVSSQGLFLNSGGTAQPILYGGESFPASLAGEPFAELISDTRSAAE